MSRLIAPDFVRHNRRNTATQRPIEGSELVHAAVSGVKLNAVAATVVTVLQLGQLFALARLLAPSDFGFMAMSMVAIGFAQTFADAGLSNAIIHRQDATADQLSSLYWFSLGTGVVLYTLVLAVAPLIAAFYGEPRIYGLLLLMAPVFLIVPSGQQFRVLLQKELLFARLAAIEIVAATSGTGAALILALSGYGVFALAWGQLTVALATSFLLIVVGCRTWRPTMHFDTHDLKGYMAFGLFQMGERSTYYLASNIDKLAIGYFLGGAAVGIYSVAYGVIVRPVQALNPIITRVAFPVFSKVQTDNSRLRRGYLQVIEMIAFVSTPLYIGIFVFAEPLVDGLLGDQWHTAAAVVRILSFLGLLYSVINPVGTLLLAKGRADLGFAFNVLAFAIYVVAITVGSRWGIIGVAWGLVVTTASVLLPLEFLMRWQLIGMSPLEWLKVSTPFFVIAVAMASMMGVAGQLSPWSHEVLRLALMFTVGMIVYAGGVVFCRRAFLKKLIGFVRSSR